MAKPTLAIVFSAFGEEMNYTLGEGFDGALSSALNCQRSTTGFKMQVNHPPTSLEMWGKMQEQIYLLTLSQVQLWILAALLSDSPILWRLCQANADRLIQSAMALGVLDNNDS